MLILGTYFTNKKDALNYAKERGKLLGYRFIVIKADMRGYGSKDYIVISQKQICEG